MKWSVKMWTGKCDDIRKILSASWSWQEFIEFLSDYSDTLYDKHKIKTSWADERINDEGYGMNNGWQTGRIKVPRGQSSREKAKEDKNEEKGEFLVACGIEKKIVRQDNEIEKNENGSEDNVVEHYKVWGHPWRNVGYSILQE